MAARTDFAVLPLTDTVADDALVQQCLELVSGFLDLAAEYRAEVLMLVQLRLKPALI